MLIESKPTPLVTFGWLVVAFWGFAQAQSFLVPLCISALLAFLVTPLVRLLRRVHIPEWIAIVIAGLLLILPFLGLGYLIVMQGQSFVQEFPTIVRSLEASLRSFLQGPLGQRLHLSGIPLDLSSVLRRLSDSAGQGISVLIGGISALLNAGSELALIIIFAVIFTASRGHLRRSGEKILAKSKSIHGASLLDEVSGLIQQFLVARMVIVAIIGALSIVALKITGVPYSFLLGTFVGIMTLVPAVGFIIALIPTVIVALASGESLITTLVLVGVLVVINLIEGNYLTPKMVGGRLNVNALTSFLGIFGGGLLWGVWGMFLSVPILGVIRIVFSAIPSLQPWGDLMAEREDKGMTQRLSRKPEHRPTAA